MSRLLAASLLGAWLTLSATAAAQHDPTDAIGVPEAYRSLPARAARRDLWTVRADTFVFLSTPRIGAGYLQRASVQYRASVPLMLQLDLGPAAALAADWQLPTIAQGFATVAFDGDLFGMGATAGWSTIANRWDVDGAAMVGVMIRLGRVEGIHAIAMGASPLLDDDLYGAGYVEGRVSFPVGAHWVVGAQGSAGTSGHVQGAFFMQRWLLGGGGAGSVALRVSLGGGALFGRTATFFTTGLGQIGPGLGLGLQWCP